MEAEWGLRSQDSSSASNRLLQAQLSPGWLASSVPPGADQHTAMQTPRSHSLEQSRCQRRSLKDRRDSGGPGCCAPFLWLVNLGEIRTMVPL